MNVATDAGSDPMKPLSGIRVVELAGIGPGPHAAMMLADHGAEIIRVGRPGNTDLEELGADHTMRGRTMVTADLKNPADRDKVLRLIAHADVVLEGFRPGVTERLGLGPQHCQEANPRLVYARMTGWGQTGPWATKAGHDINYLSITGALHAIGPAENPVLPLNLVGDYGGGSLFLVTGILAGLAQRASRTEVLVVDAAMVDGVSTLLQPTWEGLARGTWVDEREANLLDGAAPFYRVYQCADGGFMAVGSIEPQFYAMLLDALGISPVGWGDQLDRTQWSRQIDMIAARFATRTRDEWAKIFEDSDACVSPVLNLHEATEHPHMAARGLHRAVPGGFAAPTSPRVGDHSAPAAVAVARGLNDVLAAWELAGGVHG